MNKLQDFRFFEDGVDRGIAVRQKAKRIMELIGDRELLMTERANAQSNYYDKYTSASMGNHLRGGGAGNTNNNVNSVITAQTVLKSAVGVLRPNDISRANFDERFNELKKKREEETAGWEKRLGVEAQETKDKGSPRGSSLDSRTRSGDSPRFKKSESRGESGTDDDYSFDPAPSIEVPKLPPAPAPNLLEFDVHHTSSTPVTSTAVASEDWASFDPGLAYSPISPPAPKAQPAESAAPAITVNLLDF